MKIAVVDGQGGGIGYQVILQLREKLPEDVEIIALGTNAVATQNMLKAKANRGASGENAIVRTVNAVDVIVGTLSIVAAHSMMGELTPAMAEAIAASRAIKVLLPHNQSQIEVISAVSKPLPHLIEDLVARLQELLKERKSSQSV
ncbi:MAG: DUF3842 family protein [Bacillota bacterium]|nr:DUF3842 family protein [Bacillota bacterium]